MGKRPVESKLPTSSVIEDGKEGPPKEFSILTAEEYRNAVISCVGGVENGPGDDEGKRDLSSAMRRLMLSRYDPPLPLFWTFIAVEKSMWLDMTAGKDQLEFGAGILNFAERMFQSLRSLTAINASGRTALSAAAPILGLLYDVAALLSSTVGSLDATERDNGTVDKNGKRVCKLTRKLKESIRDLLGFTVLCHDKDTEAFERSFSLPPAPNVALENFLVDIYPPFPLASKNMAKSLSRDLSNVALVAEIVGGEVVLLQLVVESIHRRILLKKQNTGSTVGQAEFVQTLKSLALSSVWTANSNFPSEMILDLLHETRLPVLDLLDAREEIILRGVLFEAVLVDAPLFCHFDEADGELNTSKSGLGPLSVVFMKKLSVARRAVAFFRSQEERSRLLALHTEMTSWVVPPQLLKWLNSQTKPRLPLTALQNQQSLLNWLVYTAEKSQFAAILDKSGAKGSSALSTIGTAKHAEDFEVESGDVQSDKEGEDLFFVDTDGETQTEIDLNAAADLDFTAAAKSIKEESGKVKGKKKKEQSKVLFQIHEQPSTRTKRSRKEIDDAHLTSSSSGSDSEGSDSNFSKSAKKKVKKSESKAGDETTTSEEDEDDDDTDGALASTRLVSREGYPMLKSAYVSSEQLAGLTVPPRTETPESASRDGAFGKFPDGEVVADDFVKTSPNKSTDSGVNFDQTNSSNATTKDRKHPQGKVNFAEDESILSADLAVEILGRRQEEDGNGQMQAESDQNGFSPVITRASRPDGREMLGVGNGVRDTAPPGVEPPKSPMVNVVDEIVSQGGILSLAEETILSAAVVTVAVGSQQAENAGGRRVSESKENSSMSVDTQASLQTDEAHGTAPPGVDHMKSPPKSAGEKTKRWTQGSPTSTGSEFKRSRDSTDSPTPKKKRDAVDTPTPKKYRDATDTPTSRKKRPKPGVVVELPEGVEERAQPEGEGRDDGLKATLVEMSEGGKAQNEREVRTPEAVEQVSDTQVVTVVKPSSRKRKVKPATPQSVGSDTTADETLYQRRTRSGRALGTPTPTPTKKGSMRRKLALEPLEEEK